MISHTISAEDHVPGLTRCIITSDLSVEEDSASVRVLRFVLVHNHTFLLLLGMLHSLGRWSSLSGGDLGSDRYHSPTSRSFSINLKNNQKTDVILFGP